MAGTIRGQCMVFLTLCGKLLGAGCLVRGQVSHYFCWLSPGQGVPKRFVRGSPRSSGRAEELPPDAAVQR